MLPRSPSVRHACKVLSFLKSAAQTDHERRHPTTTMHRGSACTMRRFASAPASLWLTSGAHARSVPGVPDFPSHSTRGPTDCSAPYATSVP
eukprot:3725171-Rhodomonas_salina.3